MPLLLLLLSSCSSNSSSIYLPGTCLLLWASFTTLRDYKQESFCFIIQKFLTFLYCKFCLKMDQIFLLSSLSALVHPGFCGRQLQTEQLTSGFHLRATNILDCPVLGHYFQFLLRFECALTMTNHQTLEDLKTKQSNKLTNRLFSSNFCRLVGRPILVASAGPWLFWREMEDQSGPHLHGTDRLDWLLDCLGHMYFVT